MNTKEIKKKAIAIGLGYLLTQSCTYSPETQARWDSMEPNVEALRDFQHLLARFAFAHFKNELDEILVNSAISFCTIVGRKVGHVLSQGTTGTWGVRISELENIKKILMLPDYELHPIGTTIELYGDSVKIINYKIDVNWIVVKYRPTDPEVNEWEACYYYNDLEQLRAL